MPVRPTKVVSYALGSHAFGDKPVGIQTGPGGEKCALLKKGPKGFAVADFGEGDVETECTNALLEIALKPTAKAAPKAPKAPRAKATAKAKAAPKASAKAKAVAKKPAAGEAPYEASSAASDSDSHEAGLGALFAEEEVDEKSTGKMPKKVTEERQPEAGP